MEGGGQRGRSWSLLTGHQPFAFGPFWWPLAGRVVCTYCIKENFCLGKNKAHHTQSQWKWAEVGRNGESGREKGGGEKENGYGNKRTGDNAKGHGQIRVCKSTHVHCTYLCICIVHLCIAGCIQANNLVPNHAPNSFLRPTL